MTATPNTMLRIAVSATAADHDIEALRSVLYSPAWETEFAPWLERLIARWTEDLLIPSVTRKNLVPDDYLRGGIAVARALLAFPHGLVAEATAEEAARAQAAAVEGHYERVARDGRPAPLEGPLPADPV